MNWDTVNEGTIGGIAAAVVLGAIQIGYARFQDWLREREVRANLRKPSPISSIDGFRIIIQNNSPHPFRVRSLTINRGVVTYSLNYEGGVSRTNRLDPDIRLPLTTFPEVEPYTGCSFLLPESFNQGVPESFDSVTVTVDFRMPSGDFKVIAEKVSKIEDIRAMLAHSRKRPPEEAPAVPAASSAAQAHEV